MLVIKFCCLYIKSPFFAPLVFVPASSSGPRHASIVQTPSQSETVKKYHGLKDPCGANRCQIVKEYCSSSVTRRHRDVKETLAQKHRQSKYNRARTRDRQQTEEQQNMHPHLQHSMLPTLSNLIVISLAVSCAIQNSLELHLLACCCCLAFVLLSFLWSLFGLVPSSIMRTCSGPKENLFFQIVQRFDTWEPCVMLWSDCNNAQP